MSNYDIYLERVNDLDDKPLLEEAIKDANAGAFRSAYIMTWLSCAESLKRRFKVAAPRDGAAQKIVGNYEQKEKEAKSIDLFLLEKARDYGFVTGADHLRLKQIYEKRCLFGHPYETAPLETEVLDAMSVATSCLLSIPVRMRHGYLEAQTREVVTNKIFLDDYEPAVKAYAQEIKARAAAELLGWWLSKMWKQASPMIQDPSTPWLLRRICWVSEIILNDLDACTVNSAFNDSLANESALSSICLARSSAFQHLEPLQSDQVVSKLLEQAAMGLHWVCPLLDLESKNLLSPRQLVRLNNFLDGINVAALLNVKVPLARVIDRVIANLQTYDWNIQNPTAEALSNLSEAEFTTIPLLSQEKLGRNLLQAAQKARECSNFISNCGNGQKSLPPRIIYGMLAEMFYNDAGRLRPKLGCAESVIRTVGRLPVHEQNSIIDEAVGILNLAQHKNVSTELFEGAHDAVAMWLPVSVLSPETRIKFSEALTSAEASARAEYEKRLGRPPPERDSLPW